ncbi:unnamed protein product [Chironomus riparius]|uniref:Uncharacterized protein n=1 Tax=Chironomus riparius TaxID=315576 RepID=A0A9N9S4K2_9DIPT|nr:unnamed protein product [Chironomus riparius]
MEANNTLKLFSASLLLISSINCETINMDCSMMQKLFQATGFISYCEVKSSLIIHDRNTFINLQSSNTDQIFGVKIINQEVFYIPKFDKKFQNDFLLFSIIKSKLQEINSEDLYNFISLEVLELNGNEITYLGANLLIRNTKLRTVDFSSNRINSIHVSILESMQKLKFFNFFGNGYESSNECGVKMCGFNNCTNESLTLINEPVKIKKSFSFLDVFKVKLEMNRIGIWILMLITTVGFLVNLCWVSWAIFKKVQ